MQSRKKQNRLYLKGERKALLFFVASCGVGRFASVWIQARSVDPITENLRTHAQSVI